MARRLNDTQSLVNRPLEGELDHNISVRKMQNGDYLTRTSTYNPGTGASKCAEVVTREAPKLQLPTQVGGGDATGSKGLQDVKEYLGNDV